MGHVLAVALLVVAFAARVVTGTGADADMVTMLWLEVIAVFMWTGAGRAIKATRFRKRAAPRCGAGRNAVSAATDIPLVEAIRRRREPDPGGGDRRP